MVRKSEKIAKNARVRVEKWQSYFKENINQYHMMHEFVLGKQWKDDEEEMMTSYNKIPLQFNNAIYTH